MRADAAETRFGWKVARAADAARCRPLLGDGTLAVVVSLVAFAVFAPALGHGFVDWDDATNFLHNPRYRGLGPDQLSWMFRNVHTGHWIPITWLTFGLDYTIWGLDPFGYHLTSVTIHAVNAALTFLVARRLFVLALEDVPAGAVKLGAIMTALAFAVHPLRVESVVWITERRDVLSGFFALLTVLAYVNAHAADTRRPGLWKLASLLAFQLGMMSKSIVISLPILLLLLDVYPLRRVSWKRGADVRRAVREKLPYLALAVAGAVVAVQAGRVNDIFSSIDSVSVLERVGLTAYSVWFYLSRTIVPLGLSPLHGLPPSLSLFQLRFLGSLAAAAALVVVALWKGRRYPAIPAALAAYVLILAPVSGVLHNGSQLVAERYSYLACLPWALLLGGTLCLTARSSGTSRRPLWRVAVGGTIVWLITVMTVTVAHTGVWRDTDTLWRAALEADPSCSACHYLYGIRLRNGGDPEKALGHFAQALALRPTPGAVELYLAQSALCRQAIGDDAAADEELAILARVSPSTADIVERMMVSSW